MKEEGSEGDLISPHPVLLPPWGEGTSSKTTGKY